MISTKEKSNDRERKTVKKKKSIERERQTDRDTDRFSTQSDREKEGRRLTNTS